MVGVFGGAIVTIPAGTRVSRRTGDSSSPGASNGSPSSRSPPPPPKPPPTPPTSPGFSFSLAISDSFSCKSCREKIGRWVGRIREKESERGIEGEREWGCGEEKKIEEERQRVREKE